VVGDYVLIRGLGHWYQDEYFYVREGLVSLFRPLTLSNQAVVPTYLSRPQTTISATPYRSSDLNANAAVDRTSIADAHVQPLHLHPRRQRHARLGFRPPTSPHPSSRSPYVQSRRLARRALHRRDQHGYLTHGSWSAA
jgi:hypothetical protein